MALIDKASLLMVPSTYEAGKLYNVLPSGNRAPDNKGGAGYDQTRADFDFDRGSNAAATRIGSDGLIKKYRENLLLQSNAFSTSPWNTNLVTATSGQSGYNGNNNAWKIDLTGAAGNLAVGGLSVGSVGTYSVYAKAGTLNWILLGSQTGNIQAYINLSDGSIGTTGAKIIEAKTEDVGGGWYRCSMTYSGTATVVRVYPAQANGNLTATSGNIYIQDAQLETGMVATDYLESTSVTAKAGVLIDLPRIDYSSGAGALLLEPQRANLVQYSEYINTTDWNHQGVTSSVNTSETTSPEGLYNAVKFTATNTDPYIFKSISVSTGDNTFSFYVKGTGSSIGKTARILFWYIGTATGAQTSHDFTLTGDWQRVDATTSPTGAGTLTFRIDIPANTTVVGDSCYLYGLQLEAGSYPTSYIPNHGESGGVTRAADSCDGGGSAESINSTEGVLYAEISGLSTDPARLSISDGTNNNNIYIELDSSNVNAVGRVGGSNQFALSSSQTITNNNKVAIKYKANDFSLYINGTEVATDTSGNTYSANTLTSLQFNRGDGGVLFYGNVKQVAVFNEALSDSELATLTTL